MNNNFASFLKDENLIDEVTISRKTAADGENHSGTVNREEEKGTNEQGFIPLFYTNPIFKSRRNDFL